MTVSGILLRSRKFSRLHIDDQTGRRKVGRSSFLQSWAVHEDDGHSVPLDLSSNHRDLFVCCENFK